MKINEQQPRTQTDLALNQAQLRSRPVADAPASAKGAAATPAAKVELSSRSRELHAALELAKQAPDVRAGVVADVKQRIANGTYEVDPARIARAMLDRRA